MSTTERGRRAEAIAAAYLEARGMRIADRNWRTRYSEIDLVVRDITTVHFVEIKYRANVAYGDGFEYISPDKRERLIRASASWCQQHHYDGPYQIDVISVVGNLDSPQIDWLPNAVEG